VCGGALLGFGLAALVGAVLQSPSFSFWRSLGTPPGKASLVLALPRSDQDSVTIKTLDGKAYAHAQTLFSGWELKEGANTDKVQTSSICRKIFQEVFLPAPPGAIQDCANNAVKGVLTSEQFFAVLQDGSVWQWRIGLSDMENLLLAIACILLGAALGGGVAVLINRTPGKNPRKGH
jgi:hypothetical protein